MIVRDDEKVKKIIAENIVRYRRECNLTQAELAEKIHYSDKSVSKWERADGVPDIFVLVMLAELFACRIILYQFALVLTSFGSDGKSFISPSILFETGRKERVPTCSATINNNR